MGKNKKRNRRLTKKQLIIISSIIIFLIVISLLFNIFRDYTKLKLNKNSKSIFMITDLKIDNLEYGNSTKEAEKEFGKPIKEETKQKNGYNYKIYKYDGMTLTFKENYEDFILVKARIEKNRYSSSRGIKVGTSIKKVMKSYLISNNNGNYMYGNYSESSLKDISNLDNIYYGKREKEKVTYVYRDKIIYKDTYKIPDNIAKITYEYKHGRISIVEWSYDVE